MTRAETPSSLGSPGDSEAASGALAFWRALTRDNLDEAERLLLQLPVTTGSAFAFGGARAAGGSASDEGESPASPVVRLWSSDQPVTLHLVDAKVDCCGIIGKVEDDGVARLCLEPADGVDGCDKVSHRRNKASGVDGAYLICSPKGSATAKLSGFTRPILPVERLPRVVSPRARARLLIYEARPGCWRTALDWIPTREEFLGFELGVETGLERAQDVALPEDPVEPEDEESISEETLDELRSKLRIQNQKISGLEAKLRELEQKFELAADSIELLQLRDSCLGQEIGRIVDRAIENRGGMDGPSEFRGRQNREDWEKVLRAVQEQEGRVKDLSVEVNSPGGRLGLALLECRKIEARTDLEAVEMGGDIYRSEDDVAALLASLGKEDRTEPYSCVVDFNSLLFFSDAPHDDYEGVMSTENARIKAGYKSARAARMMASHQIQFPPILRKGSGSAQPSNSVLARSWATGMCKFSDFEGPHKTGLKHHILRNIKVVKPRLEAAIRREFPRGSKGAVFCEEALNRAYAQVKDWLESVGTLYQNLLDGKMPPDRAWELCLLYIGRLFLDIDEVRSIAQETSDPNALVWSALRCHRRVDEWAKHNWIEHPKVGSLLVMSVLELQGELEVEAGSESAKKAVKTANAAKDALTNLKQEITTLKGKVKKLEDEK